MYFSMDCVGCSYCFGCVGLRKQKYCWFNEPVGKDEFERRLAAANLGSWRSLTEILAKAREHWLTFPRKFCHQIRNTNVSGEYVYESKNARDVYQVRGVEDARYCQFMTLTPAKDIYDLTEWGAGAELVCDSITVGGNSQNVKYCFAVWSGALNAEYSMYAPSCRNIFGCVNLKSKQYCILNKQYGKNEYEKLREKIIADLEKNPYVDKAGRVWKYGEFLPYDLTPFAYNESHASQYWPLEENEVVSKEWEWQEPAQSSHKITMPPEKMPDSIDETGESVLGEVLSCGSCGKAFRLIPLELNLLKKFGFPIPRRCPDCRHMDRMGRINPPKLWLRKCQCAGLKSESGAYENTATHFHGGERCPNEFQTAIFPNRPEIVYCEACYQAEVA